MGNEEHRDAWGCMSYNCIIFTHNQHIYSIECQKIYIYLFIGHILKDRSKWTIGFCKNLKLLKMQHWHYYLWDKDDGIQIQRTKRWYKIGTTRTIGLKIRSSQSNSF